MQPMKIEGSISISMQPALRRSEENLLIKHFIPWYIIEKSEITRGSE